MPERHDVVVLGGGLAGLTFAIQLKQQRPQTSVAVLDRREGAAPEAAFKVGESTVPSGAHYFAEIVGAKDHLEQHHLRKMGLRFFLPEGDNSDITRRIEVGPFDYPPHDNFQVDRGRFENELARRSVELGVNRLEGTRVTGVELGDEVHTVRYDQKGEDNTIEGRWVVDAAGRAGIIKNLLGLAEPVPHHINASWFRLAGGLNLEDWGANNPEWLGRLRPVGPGHRQFSTNHLLDQGYWVWLIPLGSGPISIGIVADPRFHPYDEINTFDKVLDWLRAHEPQLAASVEPRVHEVEDFLTLEDFAYGAKQVFSADRWCLVGEAGFFADPFYSPGSDFIGYSNLFTGDLAARDLDGEDIADRAEYWNAFYMRAYENALNRTRDLYPIFGNPAVMLPKLAWDGVLNHSGLVLLMLKNKITDLEFMKRVRNEIEALFSLNIRMQQLFRDWNQLEQRTWEGPPPAAGPFRPLLEGFQAIVQDYDDNEMHGRLRRQVQVAEAMAVALFWRAAQALPEPPDLDRPINPYAVTLDRDAWGALYDSPGLTLEQALEIAPGMQMIWLEPAAVS